MAKNFHTTIVKIGWSLIHDGGEIVLFVNIVLFSVKRGKEQEFKDWFKESNAIFATFEGFISRTLLVSGNGAFAAIVEHKNKDTFTKMHGSKERDAFHAKIAPIFEAEPKSSFYEVVEL